MWPDLDAPAGEAAVAQARGVLQAEIARRHAALKERLTPGALAAAELSDGELRFLVDGRAVIDRVFVAPAEADLVLAQWRLVARGLSVTESTKAERLTRELRNLLVVAGNAAADQVLALDGEVAALDAGVARLEAAMEALLAGLHGLDDAERALVAAG